MRRTPGLPILIVDDEPNVLRVEETLLRSKGLTNLISTPDSREALRLVREREIELVLLDLVMPEVSGRELLTALRDEHPETPVIVVTATDAVSEAVACMRAGAFDYLVKPVEEDLLLGAVRRAVELRDLQRSYRDLRHRMLDPRLEHPQSFSAIITRSPRMRSLFLYAESIAPTSETVLITGETGVGKELFARALHEVSGRPGGFVPVSVAGLDDTAFSDTLFGHTRGAFTGAAEPRAGLIRQASEGTLFLDEIGDLDTTMQLKLLRLLEGREYYQLGSDRLQRSDARIVAATNRDLRAALQEGQFRRDLYYRLETHEIRIPPLRERKEDLPYLVDHFLDEACERFAKPRPQLSPRILPLLRAFDFPGNVRQLRSMVFDAMGRHRCGPLSAETFAEAVGEPGVAATVEPVIWCLDQTEPLPTLRQGAEILIAEALRRADGNISRAATLLGISRQALSKRLREQDR